MELSSKFFNLETEIQFFKLGNVVDRSQAFILTTGSSPRGRGAKENTRKFLLQYLFKFLIIRLIQDKKLSIW